jgi:hypothetical protein
LPYTIYFCFVDVFGKAKKKILKLDEETVSGDYEGQARTSSTSQFTSSYIPVDTEPQEIGKNDSSRIFFLCCNSFRIKCTLYEENKSEWRRTNGPVFVISHLQWLKVSPSLHIVILKSSCMNVRVLLAVLTNIKLCYLLSNVI